MTNKLYQDKKWLTQKYLSENKTQQEIAQICEAGKSTIGTWCRKFGLTKQNPHLNSRNKLSSNKPKLMEEWSENNTLDPDQITTHSSKKAADNRASSLSIEFHSSDFLVVLLIDAHKKWNICIVNRATNL